MKDSQISEMGLEEFGPRLIQTEGAKRTALSGTLELTFRCNSRCVHCYVSKRRDDDREKEKELNCEAICHVLDEIAEAGCLRLLLTGGEPLIQDVTGLVQRLKAENFRIQVETNATIFRQIGVDWYTIGRSPDRCHASCAYQG